MISIIMPTMNNRKNCKAAIDAILANTEADYELIIVESESTDGTAKMVDDYAEKYDHIRAFHTKKEGLIKAFNYGINQTEHDVYLTHDDVIVPKLYGRDWLTELIKASKVKTIGMVTTINAGGIDTAGDYLLGFRWVGTWSMLITREAINKIGVLDGNMKTGDDLEYCYRMTLNSFNIGVCNFWVDHHRQGEHVEDRTKFDKIVKESSKYFKEKHKL